MDEARRLGLENDVMDKIRAVFKRHAEIEIVKIYGSRAKGNFKHGSDIDLTFIGQQMTQKTLNKISRELDDLLLPYSFDLSLFSNIKNQDLIDHINRISINFYARK